MKLYTLFDGYQVRASSPGDFVSQLKRSSWYSSAKQSKQQYMMQFVDRLTQFENDRIFVDSNTPSSFVSDLIDAGLLHVSELN